MKKYILMSVTTLAIVLSLGACTQSQRQGVGIASGAVVGGVAGNALGGGTAGTIAGAAVGGVVGNELAK